jgi:hypothetical protein
MTEIMMLVLYLAVLSTLPTIAARAGGSLRNIRINLIDEEEHPSSRTFGSSSCEEDSKLVDVQLVGDDCQAASNLRLLEQNGESVEFAVSNPLHPDTTVHWYHLGNNHCVMMETALSMRAVCTDEMAVVDLYVRDHVQFEAHELSFTPCGLSTLFTCHMKFAVKCAPSKCRTGGKRLSKVSTA